MRAKNTQDSPKETQEGEQLPLPEIRKAIATKPRLYGAGTGTDRQTEQNPESGLKECADLNVYKSGS